MTDRKKKCSVNNQLFIKHSDIDLASNDKNSNESHLQSSKRIGTRKHSEKFSFFGSYKPKGSSCFFGSNKNTYIDDKPAPETLSDYYEQRKKILFGKLNMKQNEKEILKIILLSQRKANELIKGKSGFFFSPSQIHGWAIALKENISNYCLILHIDIISKKINKANELFLLMHQQNKELLASIALLIKKNFRNMSNSNRIGKFYPSIIKIFFQILSVMIKLAAKFNKNLIENFYLKMYVRTIYVIRETIINRFTSANNDLENDFKLIGRCYYYNCIYTISIYFLYKYQPLNIIMSIFQFIIEQYHGKDIMYLINSEQILLLKTYYNLALLDYANGNNIEAIVNLNQSKERLREIVSFPHTILKDNYNLPSNAPPSTNKMNSNDSNYPDRTSISSFNIDESVDKVIAGTGIKKRSISSKVGRDMIISEKNFEPSKKICNNIIFGNEKFIFKEQQRFINDCIRQKIMIEIELFLAEIELEQKNYQQSFNHINKILDTVRQPQKTLLKEKPNPMKNLLFNNNSPNNSSFYLKWDNYNKTSYSNNMILKALNIPKIQLCQTISESNKRYISYILEEIEQEFKKRSEYANSNNDLSNIMDDYSKSSQTERLDEYDRRYNLNLNRENKIFRETEKFFIFICGLSLYQLKILNEFQPEPSKKRDDLPILFPSQFKDCLTFSQRLALNNLDTMSLSRYLILKNSNKDICPENLDYVFLTRKIKSSHKEKNLDIISSKNNNYYFEISKKIYKSGSEDSSKDSAEGKNRKNIKVNLFDKERFNKFVEEDKIFNEKINEITKKDNKKFLEENRNKIIKILHGLNQKDKQLLIKSSKFFNDFLKKIEKKMSKIK